MDPRNERSEKKTFAMLASKRGLAIAVIDGDGREIYVTNNNSICRNLNPSAVLSAECAKFCGQALDHVAKTGKMAAFECHAGLACRAVPVNNPNTPLVAIVGRTFVKAENYRRATERAITGDWSRYSPSEFFENILLAGSDEALQATATEVETLIRASKAKSKSAGPVLQPSDTPRPEPQIVDLSPQADNEPEPLEIPSRPASVSNLVEKFNREIRLEPAAPPPKPKAAENETTVPPTVDDAPPEQTPHSAAAEPTPVKTESRDARVQAWRSFLGSIPTMDHPGACESMLAFIADQYTLSSLMWLDRKENKFESTVGFGSMKGRRLRLGIAVDDHRLVDAVTNSVPLELGERPGTPGSARIMTLFPFGVCGEISSAIAILDPVGDEISGQIVRMCQAVAPQIEILRLRSEIAQREAVAAAVAKFGQSLRQVDSDDFWTRLVQDAAEIMHSERSSLLMYDDTTEKLEVKAVAGVREWTKENSEIGARVAKFVVAKHRALLVPDLTKTRLPPAAPTRQYKTDSFMSCPVSIGDRVIGVMNFTDRASGAPFDTSALELYQAFAPQMAVAIDRASLKNKAGEFEQLSVTDQLTGLLNRRYIEARLSEEIKRSNRHGFPMSFMMLDVDHFKSYNDAFGHPAGDEALKLVGQVIRDTLRGADVAARYGGEEFAILLPQTTGDEASAIGERIRQNIEQADFVNRKVTVSIGVASCSAELCVRSELVSAADKALYEAKELGRNRVLAFESMAK